jgi:hypothetical protein
VLSENISLCESSELPAVSRSEFGGDESSGGERDRGCDLQSDPETETGCPWKLVIVPGIIFLFFSGYRRRPDSIASFVTDRDKEERRWTRSMST